jgi:hypothetical protein
MVAAACPDAEFIELWHTHGSVTKVGKALGITTQNVRRRRRHMETKYNIKLDAHAEPNRAQHYKQLSPEEHKANHHLGIENGTVIVGSDLHAWPGIRTTAFRAFLKFVENMSPKAVVMNGDVFDGSSISRHPRIGWENHPTVLDELRAAQMHLTDIEDVAGRAKLVWPLGNHCQRFSSRLAANAPEFAGVHGFQLKDHFPAWVPCWAVWANASTVIKHRLRSGVHATHNNTVNSGVSIVTGHLHSLKVTPFTDYTGTRYGVDTGTLADTNGPQFVNYTESGPTNWRSGFAVLTFWKGKLLWPELVHVIEPGKVQFRGQVLEV